MLQHRQAGRSAPQAGTAQQRFQLANLFRGAGLSGLAGIRPRSGRIAHPLLCFDKRELVDLLEERKLAWREDASNADQSFKRNWVRHTLLPLVESELNPRIASSLGARRCRELGVHAEIARLKVM